MVNFTHRPLYSQEILPCTDHSGGLVRPRPGLEAGKERSPSIRTEIQSRFYLLTYLLTPLCRFFLEKLTGLQLVKKLPPPPLSRTPLVLYPPPNPPPLSLSLGHPNPPTQPEGKPRTSLFSFFLSYPLLQILSLEAKRFSTNSKNPPPPHFTEPDGSLPHSQASATCLYPGPAQSSPYTHIPPPGDLS